MERDRLVQHIIKQAQPDPKQSDQWAMGVFKEDPDEESLTRIFVAFGRLRDCAEAVAGCLTRKPKLPPAVRTRILSFQGEVPAIDCRENDFSF